MPPLLRVVRSRKMSAFSNLVKYNSTLKRCDDIADVGTSRVTKKGQTGRSMVTALRNAMSYHLCSHRYSTREYIVYNLVRFALRDHGRTKPGQPVRAMSLAGPALSRFSGYNGPLGLRGCLVFVSLGGMSEPQPTCRWVWPFSTSLGSFFPPLSDLGLILSI